MSTVPDTSPSLHLPVGRHRSRIVLPVLLALSLVAAACDPPSGDGDASAGSSPTEVAATDIEPEFVEDPGCFGLEPADAEQLECGTVEVPLDHDAPDEGSAQLAVVVDEAADTDGAEAPLLVLGGGPG